jgi:hypothetical protein
LQRRATEGAADWYWILTGKAVTRLKGVNGKHGLQETGDFAKFLGQVFDVFGIHASTAAQVKMWNDRVDSADLKERIHPDDLWEALNSPEALENAGTEITGPISVALLIP